MIPSAFDYYAPKTVAEAVALLQQYGEEAKVLAGGQSLLPLLKLRLATPRVVVDLGRIPDLAYIRQDGNEVAIGAMTRHETVEQSEVVRRHCRLLAATAATIGDVQVRNRGTIGGSLAHADPAGDFPAAVLAAEARLKVVGPGGERWIAAEDFFVDVMTTALDAGEILTEIRVPVDSAHTRSAYEKVRQKASGFALCGVAVRLQLDENRRCQGVAVGVTGVGAKAYRARAVEEVLRGEALTETVVVAAAEKAAQGVEPSEDAQASAAYRAHLARVCTRRALRRALAEG